MTTTQPHLNALHSVSLSVGGFSLEGFSISGLSTWLHVKELDAVFDMGECAHSVIPVRNVFLTHVHGDHSRCLPRHWQLRKMMNQDEATYYIPASAVGGFKEIIRSEVRMEGGSVQNITYPNFQVLTDPAERVAYKKGFWATAFEVEHRAPSQGFTIGRTTQKLKPEYEGLEGREIGVLRKAGTNVTDELHTALFTFIGDCTGRTLFREKHIWDSQVLVIECTYIDEEHRENAVDRQHTHLDDIVEILSRTPAPKCQALVLKHFSMKYGPSYVKRRVMERIPASWRDRVHILLPPESAE